MLAFTTLTPYLPLTQRNVRCLWVTYAIVSSESKPRGACKPNINRPIRLKVDFVCFIPYTRITPQQVVPTSTFFRVYGQRHA